MRLDHLRDRGIPVPDVGDEHSKLMTNLEQVATSEALHRRVGEPIHRGGISKRVQMT